MKRIQVPKAMYKLTLKYLAGVTAFTLVYVAAAKFGLWLVPGVQNSVTPVWPPAGIALAVILVFGYRFWPGILIGAFAITASLGFPVTTALGIGVGNTLEAMLATYLLRRGSVPLRARPSLGCVGIRGHGLRLCRRPRSYVWSGLSRMGPGSGPLHRLSDLVDVVLGDALGMLLVTPLLLTWSRNWRDDWTLAQVHRLCS